MVELGLTQKQNQTLSPQMIQCMEVLQMTSQELLEYVETALQDNPVLECQEYYDGPGEADGLRRELAWLESTDLQNRDYYRQDSAEDADPLRSCATRSGQETLYHHLTAQLDGLALDGETALCARALAASLDQNGWLEEDLPALARELGLPERAMERALEAVQSLEPAGVGARTLSECLRLQLLRRPPLDKLALRIVEEHLDALPRCRYGWMAQALKASQEQVRRACSLIRSLDPRPGLGYAADRGEPVYIVPDIIVTCVHGRFELLPNHRFFPTLKISAYYSRLLRESDDAQVQDYLTGKLRQAKWTIRAVDQRRSTLMACAGCLVEEQRAFFSEGPGSLKPLSLADVAQRVGLHESTVSRAVNGKYLQCAMGTYPMSYFFSRRLGPAEGGGASSVDSAKALLKRLIDGEDKRRPLSDEKLCRLMAQEGCALSRRTAAKYRDELGIPSTIGRRLQE